MSRQTAELPGLLAEFSTSETLLRAIDCVRSMPDPPPMEAYSPFPVEGLDQRLQRPRSKLPLAMFAGGLLGALTGYGMQVFAMTLDYPLNVGGRPLHSWPAFVPVTFELTILFAAVTGFFGVLVACRLPTLYRPVMKAPDFNRASQDRFFLLVSLPGDDLRRAELRRALATAEALSISEVPA